jgi:uncharacterized membrane protein
MIYIKGLRMMMVLITKEKRHCMIEEDRNDEHVMGVGFTVLHGLKYLFTFFFFFFFFSSSFYANNRKIPKRKKKEFDCFYKGVQSLPDS